MKIGLMWLRSCAPISGETSTLSKTCNGDATINIGSANTSTTFAGVIQNGGNTLQVIKSGTGQLTLTNVNTSVTDMPISSA